jgi:RNA polymerase sigma-70 factor (ECF subfamily)
MSPVTTIPDDAGQDFIAQLLDSEITRKKAEERLFRTFEYFIPQGMSRFSLTEDESFNAYSDTILSAIDSILHHAFEGRSKLKTWLFQIFHHKCVDLLRQKTTQKRSVFRTWTITDVLYQLSDPAKLAIQELADKGDWDILHEKLQQIGDSCRKLLQYWAEGLRDKEIAMAMEYKTTDVVKSSRQRCLEKLRQLYKPSR